MTSDPSLTGGLFPEGLRGENRTVEGSGFWARLELSPYNRRITVKEYQCLTPEGIFNLANTTRHLCQQYGFNKIWGKFRQADAVRLQQQSFVAEAVIDDYFAPGETALICSRFWAERRYSVSRTINQQVLKKIDYTPKTGKDQGKDFPFIFRLATPDDVCELAGLYTEVFTTYPYPVNEPEYLIQTLDHVIYGLAFHKGQLVAAASAETDPLLGNAEMTDFATRDAFRGWGLASWLLRQLEDVMSSQGICCLYSIARSTSMGMNQVFARHGYRYTGTLINNCNIAGGLEDMNVWCKST